MMACTHPAGLEPIYRDGEIVGGRCPTCGSTAYKGESWWTVFKRNVLKVGPR